MIYEIISMNGYGTYVWSAFIFTLVSFAVLYLAIKLQLVKEQSKFAHKFVNLNSQKIKAAKNQKTYKEILVNSSISKI